MNSVLEYNNKTCRKYYTEGCDSCETCIFDEDYKENGKMDSKNSVKSCNKCQYSQCSVISHGSTKSYNNWHCNYGGNKRLLDMSVPSDKDVEIPTFCPLNLSSKSNNYTKTFSNLTYTQKREMFENITPLMNWDDIKEKEVYHVPPLPSETRKDILIISKNDYSCTYRVLNSTYSNTILTMYKTSMMYKFMSKHKLKKVEVITVNSNTK